MIHTIQSDVLIVGGGMAAAMAAVAATGKGATTVLVDKGTFMESGSSPTCLGGLVTTISPEDNPKLLFRDILSNGCGISEQNLVWEAAQGAAENQQRLENLGMRFVKQSNGKLWLYRGVGHSVHRGLTVDRKALGLNPVAVAGLEALRRGVKLYDNVMITKILGDEKGVTGAVGVSKTGTFYLFDAKSVVLAAGGANNLYPNACESIKDLKYRTMGNAFALAFDMGIRLIDMEFPNFREGRAAGISRTGGFLVNTKGERFMHKYDTRRENASRGKLVEAIYTEMRENRGPIYWELPEKIPELSLSWGYMTSNMAGKRIEVEIDFQRLLGGIVINERTETSVKGLYVAGESTGGFHGADRMQGACFLECTIFGTKAGCNAAKYAKKADLALDRTQVNEEVARLREIQSRRTGPKPSEIFERVQQTMWTCCSVVRESDEMKKGLELIRGLKEKKPSGKDLFATLEIASLILTAVMVTKASLMRKETRGTYMRRDFPKKDDEKWLKHVVVENKKGEVTTTTMPITKVRLSCN